MTHSLSGEQIAWHPARAREHCTVKRACKLVGLDKTRIDCKQHNPPLPKPLTTVPLIRHTGCGGMVWSGSGAGWEWGGMWVVGKGEWGTVWVCPSV